jgi:hypothetical protein
MFRKLDVCKSGPTSSVVTFTKPEPKLIGMYDMMGKKIKEIREEEITILLYDDGSTKKIIQH